MRLLKILNNLANKNLTSAQETTTQSSKESTLKIETGTKAGNAYVDAAYAWKAVIDAQNKAIKAAEKLKKMEKLEDEGKASQKAVFGLCVVKWTAKFGYNAAADLHKNPWWPFFSSKYLVGSGKIIDSETGEVIADENGILIKSKK